MWTRQLLKSNALNVIRRRGWWVMLMAALITNVLGGFSCTYNANDRTVNLVVGSLFNVTLYPGHWMAGAIWGSISFFVGVFVGSVIGVGYNRYLMESRQGEPPISSIFSVFRAGYGNLLLVQLGTSIRLVLWCMLLVVPGIIKSYEYFLVPYLLAENPYLPGWRARELSRQMMMGEKWSTFGLQLSFLGWWVLAALAGGLLEAIPIQGLISFTSILALPVGAYLSSTQAELYAALRAKADALGLVQPGELTGFVTYQ